MTRDGDQAVSVLQSKRAVANERFMERVFSVPESDRATLSRLEKQLGENLDEFMAQSKVAGEIPLERLAGAFMETDLPDEPCFVSDYVQYLQKEVVPYCVHTGSPKFIGHMTTAIPYFLLPLSKCMVALHQNLVKIETSRAFTLLERQCLGIIHRLIYRREERFYRANVQDRNSTLGIQCSGATSANIISLWVARNAFIGRILGPDSGKGLVEALQKAGKRNLCVLASARAHYSLRKACDLLGLGRDGLIEVPVTRNHRMDLQALRRACAAARERGLHPLAVVGIAGSTETGSIDPLDDLAEFASGEGLHFHVDAAWGGAFLFSGKHSALLRGIERADSVTMDGHKHLYLPMGIGMVFFRDPDLARHIEHEAAYIIRSGSLDLGKRSLEGSRPGMALLAHAVMRIFGRKGCEVLMDHGLMLANFFAGLIREHPGFELITAPELNILTYRYNPFRPEHLGPALNEELSLLNQNLQKQQRERGKSFVSRTRLRYPEPESLHITVLRAVLANPTTREADLREILEEQQQIAGKIVLDNRHSYPLLSEKANGKRLGKP